MLESFEKLIKSLDMLPAGSTVLCAVSGGADSVCLLHALYQLRPRLGFSLAAAHYNHQLRGEESDRDAAFAAQFVQLCCGEQRLSDGRTLPPVKLYTGSGDVAGQARLRRAGVEETARDMRYAFLRRIARETGADLIATAHNADDNAETILFHLARGAGLRGLTGIQPVQGSLIRPLLTTSRREIESYLLYYGLPHVEDRTNSDDAYARNRIRHQVLPVLEGLFPGFSARMAGTAALLRADEAYLSAQAAEHSAQALVQRDRLSISAGQIGGLPDPVAARAVRQLIGRLNGGAQNCSAAHLEAVVRLCRGTSPSAQIHLPYGLTACREYQTLVLTRAGSPDPIRDAALPLPGEAAAGRFRVVCSSAVYAGQPQGPYEIWLARHRLLSPLILRARCAGDLLRLPGRPRKTVKKWFIDEKVPRQDRDALPVLDCGGQPAAVAGLGPDAAFLPQPGEEVWHITFCS